MGFSDVAWRKSNRSTNNGSCVELGVLGGRRMAVRDSKNPEGSKLSFSKRGWTAFADRLKHP